MPDVLPMDPSLVRPASLVETNPLEIARMFFQKATVTGPDFICGETPAQPS